jgi:hypothetical protein
MEDLNWWVCDATKSLVQGLVGFSALVDIENDNLVISTGTDPDNPTKIPIDQLLEFIGKYRFKELRDEDTEGDITRVDVPHSHPSWPVPAVV